MADLLDAIEANRTRKGPSCSVAPIEASLSKANRDDFRAAGEQVLRRQLHATELSRALASLGHKVPPYSLLRHLKGECGCA